MKRNEYATIDDVYNNIICESKPAWDVTCIKMVSKSLPTLTEIKQLLMSLTGASDWMSFVNSQKVGDCALIAKTVSRMFPKMQMYSVIIKFSDEAISKMEPQDDPDMFTCSHYLNMYDGKWYDFGKGTNRYEGVYVLDGIDDMYSCLYSQEAISMLTDPRKENPKALGVYLR